jgi:hypothetical protein
MTLGGCVWHSLGAIKDSAICDEVLKDRFLVVRLEDNFGMVSRAPFTHTSRQNTSMVY